MLSKFCDKPFDTDSTDLVIIFGRALHRVIFESGKQPIRHSTAKRILWVRVDWNAHVQRRVHLQPLAATAIVIIGLVALFNCAMLVRFGTMAMDSCPAREHWITALRGESLPLVLL